MDWLNGSRAFAGVREASFQPNVCANNATTAGRIDLTDPSDQTSVLEETAIDEVWGIGRAYSKLLRDAGIKTARKLRDADRRWIRQRLTVVGARIVEELRWIRCLDRTMPTAEEVCDLLALFRQVGDLAR
jgi:DNA polymerase V